MGVSVEGNRGDSGRIDSRPRNKSEHRLQVKLRQVKQVKLSVSTKKLVLSSLSTLVGTQVQKPATLERSKDQSQALTESFGPKFQGAYYCLLLLNIDSGVDRINFPTKILGVCEQPSTATSFLDLWGYSGQQGLCIAVLRYFHHDNCSYVDHGSDLHYSYISCMCNDKHRLQHLFDDVKRMRNTEQKNTLLHVRVAKAIRYHWKCMKYVNGLESCYTVSLFLQHIMITIVITSKLYRVYSFSMTGRANLIIVSVDIAYTLGLLFANVYPAERLTDCGQNLYHNVYNAHWYDTPASTQKVIQIMLQKISEPFYFGISGLFSASFETCSKVFVYFTTEINLRLLIDTIPALMIYMIVFLKYVTIWVKNEAYNQGYEHMRIDWCKLKDVEEINTLNREYSNASKYNMLLFLFSFLLLLGFVFLQILPQILGIISPLTEINTNKLLVRTEYFVDYKDYIYLITIHATIAIMCSVTMQISSDILNNIFMMHISGMFEVIGNGVAQILLGTICMTGVMLKVSRILRNIVDSKSFLELRLYVNFKMKRNQVSQVYLDQTDRRVIQEYLNWSDESVRGVCLTRVREIIECMVQVQ
ncbi:hypothetical protein WH47_08072 [Habropoda laboriosa]|uniref:Uncharacterized protein n=1 Tax=Habropoda laboriosa TaxID=597456 RepID=A0A0L7QPM1_9HYME|nr:hypothetical protein WH47_08072 [Habropoda laboriosa]